MTPTTTATCPRCHTPIAGGAKFCANCGNDISGVWSNTSPGALGGTIAVEMDPNVDVLGQMLSEATLGDYDVYGELGRGGMAAVYLGLDLALNRKVAIKTMLPELVSREGMVARFKREAQTAAALNHPHIIQIYTVKETKQLVYFVMKFIEGRSLESVINDKGFIPLGMAQTILGQVGSALDYAHRKHVVHRDIKPANIMIDEDGWAIVTDFGIAKVQEAQNLTATGTAIGTPHYMSPEQFHNKAVTGLSDQYSLGVVAYEMLAGKKPFDGGTYAEIITQHLFEPVPDLRTVNPAVPPHVVDVIRKMLAKDPTERYPDLDSAIHALGAPASKKEGDVVRTQMIDLAKSGPQKKVRMSVPMSPIPVTKKAAAPQPTIAEPRRRPVVEKQSGSKAWVWAVVVVLLLVGGAAFAALKLGLLGPLKGAARANASVASAPAAQQPADSSRTEVASAAADTHTVAETVVPAADSAKIRADSIERAKTFTRDSIRIARAAKKAAGDSMKKAQALARANTQPKSSPSTSGGLTVVQSSASVAAQPPPAAPAVPQTAQVRLGSKTPNAALYIDGKIENLISRPRLVTIPAGVTAHLSIRAQGCENWDTTVVVTPNSNTPIGWRDPKC